MEKHCIFCGRKPEDKSKEHVVPRWLIEMTGVPNRNARFGLIKDHKNRELKERVFAFDKFTFPACSSCNQKYSGLEARAKTYICSILNQEPLSAEDVSDLLDWFDKVRVGAWLGMRQLDKNIADVDPSFHIETRIGQYDRMLIVEKSNMRQPRLNLGGADTLCFAITPSAFLLIINSYYFTSVSSMFLCSRRLGFPFITKARLHPDREEVEVDLVEGRERIMLPILRKRIAENGRRIFQPMFKGGLMSGDTEIYDTEYGKAHSLEHHLGIGSIIEETVSGIKEYRKDDKIMREPNHVQDERILHVWSAVNVLEWQLWLHQDLPDMSLLSKDQQKYFKKRFGMADRVNRTYAKHYRKML